MGLCNKQVIDTGKNNTTIHKNPLCIKNNLNDFIQTISDIEQKLKQLTSHDSYLFDIDIYFTETDEGRDIHEELLLELITQRNRLEYLSSIHISDVSERIIKSVEKDVLSLFERVDEFLYQASQMPSVAIELLTARNNLIAALIGEVKYITKIIVSALKGENFALRVFQQMKASCSSPTLNQSEIIRESS